MKTSNDISGNEVEVRNKLGYWVGVMIIMIIGLGVLFTKGVVKGDGMEKMIDLGGLEFVTYDKGNDGELPLFTSLSKVTTFANIFMNCRNITEIPSELFGN